jgi:hypothetical protein
MALQAGKQCTRSDQGINGTKISLQIVELATYCDFYLAAALFPLFGNIQEVSAYPATNIEGSILMYIWILSSMIIDHPFGCLPRFIEQFQISRIGDVGWCARGING